MNVVIIKYNAGNIRSVDFALKRLGIQPNITDDKDAIMQADRIIFPGVGEASSAMKYLKNSNLDKLLVDLNQPVLGICLGMQLMCAESEENNTPCLGIFDQKVKKFQSNSLKVPQIGWNNIFSLSTPLFMNIKEETFTYFVHSYFVEKSDNSIALAEYELTYSAAIRKNNFYAVQFHPEKSGEVGQQIIHNFLTLT